MNINATLLGQMITFLIFVLFTMKFVWPPLMKALAERKKRIADGLAAAERGIRELEVAKHKAAELIHDAKIQAASIVDKANKRAHQIIETSRNEAREEGERLLSIAKEEIQHEVNLAQTALRSQAASLAITGAERILKREVDEKTNTLLIDDLIKEMGQHVH